MSGLDARLRACRWLSTALLLVAFPQPAAAQHPPVVQGRVVDRVSGAGIPNARVSPSRGGGRTSSDADGSFVLRGLAPGGERLEVRATGYRTVTAEVELHNGQVTPLRIPLDPDPLQLEGVSVTAAGSGGPMTVLERADLDALGSADLAGALQAVTGLVVTRRGGPGSPATVSIRGGSADQVLVLLDGVPVNAPLTGGVDLSTVSLSGVERVTVLPGVQSARYGPRALSGVIVVEGRQPGPGGNGARTSAGSWGSRHLALELGGGTKGGGEAEWSGRVGGEWRQTDGDFSYPVPDVRGGGTAARLNADVRSLSVTGRGRVVMPETEVTALVDVLDLDRGMPGPTTSPTPTARQQQRRLTVGSSVGFELGARWNLALDGLRQETDFSDPAPPLGVAFHEETVARDLGVRVSAETSRGPVDLELGAEARDLAVRSTTLDPGAPDSQSLLGGWVAATTRASVGPGWSGTVTGALRADRHTFVSGTELSPKLGASLAGGRWTVRASIGNGFSPPSLADQFFHEGVLVRPNPELAPERVRREMELGTDVRLVTTPAASLATTLTLFRADVDGMILWFPDHRFVWSPDNVDVSRRGWEAGMNLWVRPAATRLTVDVSRSSVEYAGPTLTGQVAYRPEWTAHAALAATWSDWSGELAGRYVGSRRTVPGSSLNSLDPYLITDLRVGSGWGFGAWRVEGQLAVLNLFDTHAAMVPDYPLPGRSWRLELRLQPNQ